ncbi:hypothetical protein LguiB_003059 [Lonicera macranthoides]
MAKNKVDMFSNLLDSIIIIIISFLPFKEAARTSRLSKRWRHLWRSTKNIELDETLFVKNPQESLEIKENQRKLFLDFAHNWIQNYSGSTAHKFRLSFSKPNDCHFSNIQNFIQFAVTRKVKILELDFSDPMWNEVVVDNREPVIELPMCVYQHADLEAIKLVSCKFSVPEFGKFHVLKSVSLGWVQLTTSSLSALLSNCMLLEIFSLNECWDLGQITIYSSNLRTLVIDKCSSLEHGVIIDAQNLSVFKYSGSLIAFDLLDLDALVEADLDFGLQAEFSDQFGEILYGLLSQVLCVRVLSVCSYMLQDNSWLQDQGEHQFLGRSEYVIVYACMKSSLKVVEVKGFKGEGNELLVLQYFITYGIVLERLYISISNDNGPNGEDMGLIYRQNFMKLYGFEKANPNLFILIR